MVEKILSETRRTCQSKLTAAVGERRALGLLRAFEVQVARLALSKPLLKTAFEPGVAGKITLEKLTLLRSNWVKYFSAQFEVLVNVGVESGFLAAGAAGCDEVVCTPSRHNNKF